MTTQTQTTSFKAECWQAVHDLLNDDIYIALYTGNASLDQDTAVYSTTDEVVASGYSAGGQQLLSPTIGTHGFTVYADFADVSWNAALTARYALIYNASKGNKSIAVLDFGADKTSVLTFTVTFPANTSSSAVLRSSN